MNSAIRWTVVWLIVGCVAGSMAVIAAEDTLPAAKELYGAAAYPEALAMLDRLKAGNPPADTALEIDKYRAFCLFAMGNTRDAEQVVAGMTTAWPRFRLADGEASPRVVSAFRDVRRAQLPAVIEQAYTLGREAYEKKAAEAAIEQFRLVLDLSGDPDLPANQPLTKDMQTLASGFLNLAQAQKAAAETKPAPVAEKPASPPAVPVARRYYTTEDSDVVAPVPINQQMPVWPSGVRVINSKGVLEVLIDENGAVETATMRLHLHPIFDELLTESAKTWRYRPATLQSKPVKFLKRIEVNVQQSGSGGDQK